MKFNLFGLLILVSGAFIGFASDMLAGLFKKYINKELPVISLVIKVSGLFITIIGVLVTINIF